LIEPRRVPPTDYDNQEKDSTVTSVVQLIEHRHVPPTEAKESTKEFIAVDRMGKYCVPSHQIQFT